MKEFKIVIQTAVKLSCDVIVKVEYLATLGAVKGIGSKMHSLNVLGHSPL